MVTSPLINPEDYRLGGYTDTQTLQAAIDAVNAAGVGTIYLPKAYTISGVTIKSNVSICGGTLIAASGCTTMMQIANGSSNVLIRDIYFDGSALASTGPLGGVCIGQNTGTASSDITIEANTLKAPLGNVVYHAILVNDLSGDIVDNYVVQAGGDAINVNGGFVRIVANNVQNSGDGGIAMNNGASGLVDSNYIYKCDLGIGAGPNGTTGSPFCNVAFVNNTIEGCGAGIAAGWFAYSGREGPQYAKISNNKILKPKNYGIRFDGRATTPEMLLQVTDNQVLLAGSNLYDGSTGTGQGIGIVAASGSVIQGNHVTGGLGDAYYFQTNNDIVFDNNTARGNAGYGVNWVGTNTAIVGNFNEQTSASGRSNGAPTVNAGIMEFSGTTNGSGVVTIAHNLGTSAIKRIIPGSAVAYVQQVGDVYFPMTLAYIDGTNMQFTSSLASRPVNASLTLRVRPYPNY